MKVLVCGDRHWDNYRKVLARLSKLPADTHIISGAAPGADTQAAAAAKELGFTLTEFPAQWERYGRGAGPKRNLEMLAQDPGLVLAFHSNLSSSRGTAHTVRHALKRGIPTEVIE